MTRREGKFFLKDISPNAEVRYIDPKDPTRGLAVRDENTNGMFEPLDPQFGTAYLSNEFINAIGQETGTILFDIVALKGLNRLKAPIENTTIYQKLGRGSLNVGAAGLTAGLGRYAQLALGERLGFNNVTPERAIEDAFSSAAWAAIGTAAIGSTLSLLGTTWQTITGKTIPNDMLLKIARKIRDAEKTGTGEEFTTKELTDLLPSSTQSFDTFAIITSSDEVGTEPVSQFPAVP